MFETNGLKGMYLQGVEKNRALSTRGQPDMSTCTALPRGARSVACPSVVEGFFLSRHVHVPTRLAMEGTTGRQGTAPAVVVTEELARLDVTGTQHVPA